jgi:hypothetical protein
VPCSCARRERLEHMGIVTDYTGQVIYRRLVVIVATAVASACSFSSISSCRCCPIHTKQHHNFRSVSSKEIFTLVEFRYIGKMHSTLALSLFCAVASAQSMLYNAMPGPAALVKRQGGDSFIPGSIPVGSTCPAGQEECGTEWCTNTARGDVCCTEGCESDRRSCEDARTLTF